MHARWRGFYHLSPIRLYRCRCNSCRVLMENREGEEIEEEDWVSLDECLEHPKCKTCPVAHRCPKLAI